MTHSQLTKQLGTSSTGTQLLRFKVIAELTQEFDADNSGVRALGRVMRAGALTTLSLPPSKHHGVKSAQTDEIVADHGQAKPTCGTAQQPKDYCCTSQDIGLEEFCRLLAVINEREGFSKSEYDRAFLAWSCRHLRHRHCWSTFGN